MTRLHSRSRMSITILSVLLAGIVAMVTVTGVPNSRAQTVQKTVRKKPVAKKWPIGGLVTVGASAGVGSFLPGEENRPSVSTNISLLARYSPMPGLTLMAIQGMSKTLLNNSDDGAPRRRNTALGDSVFLLSWTPLIKGKQKTLTAKEKAANKAAAALNPTLVMTGKGKPLTLPGKIRVSFLSVLSLPTSRSSQYQSRRAVLAGAINLSRSFGPLSLTYQARFTKNFHKYSNAVVATADDVAFARNGGAEAVSDAYVATAFNNVSFNFRNALIATVPGPGHSSLQMVWIVINNYRYFDAPQDEFSSQFAKAGRGRSDLSYGQLAINNVFPGGYVGSLSVATFSSPFSADNKTIRFPFFDLRSTPDNLTTVGLSLTKMF